MADDQRRQNLANWFGDAHPDLQNEDGTPKRLYVGTLSNYDTFNRGRMSVEGDHGQGFYATSSPDDASVNYASQEGADFSNKLNRFVESMYDNPPEHDDGEPLNEDDFRKIAMEEMGVQHHGAVMPVHMTMKNPVVLGSKNETFYDFHEPFNEETEEYGEPSGSLIKLIEGVEEAGRQFDHPTGEIIGSLYDRARDYGGIHATDAEKIIKRGFEHAYDPDTGGVAGNEAWRTALEEAGHDGIIDHTVDSKFGSSRRGFGGAKIPGMHGVVPDTTHYIAFDNKKIKSATGNTQFDPSNPNITKKRGGDVEGKGITVYQGRSKKGAKQFFNPNGHAWGTTLPETAEQFAGKSDSHYPRATPPRTETKYNGEVHKLRFNITNPMHTDIRETLWNPDREAAKISEAKEKGHDGLAIYHSPEKTDYVAFHPSQVEHVESYTPEPIIAKADGGDVKGKRRLSSLGFYSKGAEKAADLPEGSFPAQQLISQLINKGGISKDELMHSGVVDGSGKVHPDWAKRGKITRDDLVEHFHSSLPQIEEKVLGADLNSINAAKDRQAKLEAVKKETAELVEQEVAAGRIPGENPRFVELEEQYYNLIDNPLEEPPLTKFSQFTLPGGENYREVLLKHNSNPPPISENKYYELSNKAGLEALSDAEKEQMKAYTAWKNNDARVNAPQFRSSHWDDPDVLAHIRMADRAGPNGEKILHVEEIQSDWAQAGRKAGFQSIDAEKKRQQLKDDTAALGKHLNGIKQQLRDMSPLPGEVGMPPEYPENYSRELETKLRAELAATNRQIVENNNLLRVDVSSIPSAPYVTNTQAWTDLALKRVMKEAAEGGYDHIVWTPGQQQADRYDLSKQIKSLAYDPEEKTLSYLHPQRGWQDIPGNIEPHEISDHVGKEVSEKLLAQPPSKLSGNHVLDSVDMKVGGEGMKGYYDKIVPNRLQKLAREYDPQAKVGPSQVMLPTASGSNDTNQSIQPLGIQITPQMRESILRGQSAFADGGAVPDEDEGITAYHGTPHDFEQFDTSKIGTGEGNQTYGHGLYFADAEPTARHYQELLSRGNPTLAGRVKSVLAEHNGDETATKDYIQQAIDYHKSKGDLGGHAFWRDALDQFDDLKGYNKGHMYEVHINAHPDHFLDWDEVLEDQNHHIKTALQRVADHDEAEKGYTDLHEHLADPDAYTGGAFYQNLASRGRAKEASEILNQMGIKGIRYKDAGSRSGDGKPSYNYVVFNHDHVRVRRKYMLGGAV